MFLTLNRHPRVLSSFNHAANRWAAIRLRDLYDTRPADSSHPADISATGCKQSLTLLSWNIQASQSMPAACCKLILDHILEGRAVPDVVHLQEVAPGTRQALLDHLRVRNGFVTTDAEDCRAFKGHPFATMTLLSRMWFGAPGMPLDEERGAGGGGGKGAHGKFMLAGIFRMELPSRYARDALCVDVAVPSAAPGGGVIRLVNVHLDSLDAYVWRALQVRALATLLRKPDSRGGVVAGDFNALRAAEHKLVGNYGLRDAWDVLRGSTGLDGATWGVGTEMRGRRTAKRLDKVVMLGLEPEEIDVLRPGLFRDRPWSDHCGVRCTFTI